MIVALQRREPESNTCSYCRSSAQLESWLYPGDGRRQDPQLRTEVPELLKSTVHSNSLRPLRPGCPLNQTAAANRTIATSYEPASGSPQRLLEGRICTTCQTRCSLRRRRCPRLYTRSITWKRSDLKSSSGARPLKNPGEACLRRGKFLAQVHFFTAVFVSHFIHKRLHQQNSAAMLRFNVFARGWVGHSRRIEARALVLDDERNFLARIEMIVNVNLFRRILLVSVKNSIRQTFEERNFQIILIFVRDAARSFPKAHNSVDARPDFLHSTVNRNMAAQSRRAGRHSALVFSVQVDFRRPGNKKRCLQPPEVPAHSRPRCAGPILSLASAA
jgi:hypothetical protein